jgi:hypothetical protein
VARKFREPPSFEAVAAAIQFLVSTSSAVEINENGIPSGEILQQFLSGELAGNPLL